MFDKNTILLCNLHVDYLVWNFNNSIHPVSKVGVVSSSPWILHKQSIINIILYTGPFYIQNSNIIFNEIVRLYYTRLEMEGWSK